MKNKIGILGTFAMIAAMESIKRKDEGPIIVVDDNPLHPNISSKVDPDTLKGGKVIPRVPEVCLAGAKKYFFNEAGKFATSIKGLLIQKPEDVVFTCYAINNKNAIKKFNNRNKK